MAKQKTITITLNKANKIFPDKISRVMAHDLISKSVTHKKYLLPKEQIKLQSLAAEIRSGDLFDRNCDLLVERTGRKLKFIKF